MFCIISLHRWVQMCCTISQILTFNWQYHFIWICCVANWLITNLWGHYPGWLPSPTSSGKWGGGGVVDNRTPTGARAWRTCSKVRRSKLRAPPRQPHSCQNTKHLKPIHQTLSHDSVNIEIRDSRCGVWEAPCGVFFSSSEWKIPRSQRGSYVTKSRAHRDARKMWIKVGKY